MKSKVKSLLFWASFFFLLICLMFWGEFVLIVNDVLINEYYVDTIFNIFCVIGYLFIAIYVIFAVLIFANKFPEKIKKFEKSKYLTLMIILLLGEIVYIGSVMYGFS